MNDMILHELGTEHQVPDQVGIWRDYYSHCIFHRPYGRKRMYCSAYTADPFCECPCLPRISAFQDDLQPADHGTGTEGIHNHAVLDLGFDPEVALNSCNGINYNSFCHDLDLKIF